MPSIDWSAAFTVTAGILTSIALLGAAATALAKLWQYSVFRALLRPFAWVIRVVWSAWERERNERFVEKVREALKVLFMPNGGASLFDISGKIDQFRNELSEMHEENNQRFARIEEALGIKDPDQ